MSIRNVSPKGIAHFPHVFGTYELSGKYEVTLQFTPSTMDEDDKKAWDHMKKTADEVCTEEFGVGLGGKVGGKLLGHPFKKGDPDHKYFNDPDSYYIRFSSRNRPSAVGPNPRVNLETDEVYGGMVARVSYNASAFDVSGNKGVNLYLNNLQKIRDGERVSGGGTKAEDEFDAVDVDEAAELFG